MECLVAVFVIACGAGCDDGVRRVHGRLLKSDGTAAAGYDVGLFAYSENSHASPSTQTDSQGFYELEVQVGEVRETERMHVRVESLDQRLRIEFDLRARSRDLAIPDLQLWDDALTLTRSPTGEVRVSWNPVSWPEGVEPTYRLAVYQSIDSDYSALTWSADGLSGTSFDLPDEVFEDRFATFELFAGDRPYICRDDLCVEFHSRTMTKGPGDLVALSRGAACTAETDRGEDVALLGRAGAPCSLTDGSASECFRDEWICDSQACHELDAIVVDLGSEVPVQTIVVHGLEANDKAAMIEIAHDGSSVFTAVQSIDVVGGWAFTLVRLGGTRTARYVRVSAESGITGLSELSVF